MGIEIRRSGSRFVTVEPGRTTRHSFSFGPHYDPANTSFGLLLCHNDDLVQPGHGYDDHPHRGLEIVTWVLSGALSHRDSAGRSGVIEPGTVQVMSAGSGVVHSETVAPSAGPTRFVQAWVRPDAPGGDPSYSSAPVGDTAGRWVPVASGAAPNAVARIAARDATLLVADLVEGDALELPDAPQVHLFVASGSVLFEATPAGATPVGEPPGREQLETGDAVRLSGSGGRVIASSGGQLMAWAFTRALP